MKTDGGQEAKIYIALRFHVNFYHSYRGDSLDEKGIGKDIRIIRGILDDLETLSAEGVPVRGTWDIENYYSLERYLPTYAPDIVDRVRKRVGEGTDEIEPMSWNNGLLTAHGPNDLYLTLRWAISNPWGSGVEQVFGRWAPIARPQENMFSAWQIPIYRKAGVEAVSLYYSAAPFNGFSSFVPLLSPAWRHNPLSLRDEASGESIRILPAVNHADLVEHFASLRGWLKSLRRSQLAMESPVDFLFVLDMDADDTFWAGYLPKAAAAFFPSFCGLASLVRSVSDLPWLRFALPGEYIATHGDQGSISFGQDLADGSFDGYSSWAEKAENTRLWSLLGLARRTADLARRLSAEGGGTPRSTAWVAAEQDFEAALLRSLSTTHFGMASPVMHSGRLEDAFERGREALAAARRLLGLCSGDSGTYWFDGGIETLPKGSGALADAPGEGLVVLNPEEGRATKLSPVALGGRLDIGAASIRTDVFDLTISEKGDLGLSAWGKPIFIPPLSRPWVNYGGRIRTSVGPARTSVRGLAAGSLAELRLEGSIPLDDAQIPWVQTYTLAAGLPSLRVDVLVEYPQTEARAYDRRKAERLSRTWDGRWTELAPFELLPDLGATVDRPARIWRRAFDGSVRSYLLDRHKFGKDKDLDSLNNHCTDEWVAVSGEGKGLLIAQADSAMTNFAFCPMRLRFAGERQIVSLNPFGTYYGRQWRSPPARTGLGRIAAVAAGDNYDPYAPSWAGQTLRISLMLAPYNGEEPPEALQRDALIFAHPPWTTDRARGKEEEDD